MFAKIIVNSVINFSSGKLIPYFIVPLLCSAPKALLKLDAVKSNISPETNLAREIFSSVVILYNII